MRDYKLRKKVFNNYPDKEEVAEMIESSGGVDLYRHDISFTSYDAYVCLTIISSKATSYTASSLISYVQGLTGSPSIPCSGVSVSGSNVYFVSNITKGGTNASLSLSAKMITVGETTTVTSSGGSITANLGMSNFHDVVNKIS